MNPNVIDDSELATRQYAGLREAASRETALHRAADRHLPTMQVAVRYAFAKARVELKKQLRSKKVEKYGSALTALKNALDQVIPSRLHPIVVAGGQASMLRSAEEFRTAKTSKKRIGPFAITFDGKNPEAVDWADRHAAEMIDGITETTRETINNAVAEYLETGDWDTFYNDVLESVGEERADLIAHHEVMLAVHEGQREAWQQAEDEGLLTGREQVTWIITGDDKVCPICIGLDGQTRDLHGVYEFDGEPYEGPPAHPRCRCTEGLIG